MFFEHDIKIPANTAEDSYLTETLRLSRGIIERVDLVFPSGCAGLVGVRLARNTFQVIPSNYPKWIETDGESVAIYSNIDLSVNPYELEFQGYNKDDAFDHIIRVRVLITPSSPPFTQKSAQQESDELMEITGL